MLPDCTVVDDSPCLYSLTYKHYCKQKLRSSVIMSLNDWPKKLCQTPHVTMTILTFLNLLFAQTWLCSLRVLDLHLPVFTQCYLVTVFQYVRISFLWFVTFLKPEKTSKILILVSTNSYFIRTHFHTYPLTSSSSISQTYYSMVVMLCCRTLYTYCFVILFGRDISRCWHYFISMSVLLLLCILLSLTKENWGMGKKLAPYWLT